MKLMAGHNKYEVMITMTKQKKWMEQQESAKELEMDSGGVAPENKSHGRNTQTKKQVR